VKEPYLADDAFIADVEAARGEPGVHLWWLGQSGFLIGCEGRHLLVDPYLSDSLTAKYEGTETPHVRMTRRVVAPERLRFVDLVLSTHGHTDHLDGETLRAIGAPLVCPAGIVELARERAGDVPIHPIAVGEGLNLFGFRVFACLAIHPGDCVGYTIHTHARGRQIPRLIYHAGDTEYHSAYKDCDICIVPINGKLGNMNGVEAARFAADEPSENVAIPCHFDMFEFNTASPDEFVAECERLGQDYCVLEQGERLTMSL
jgi:L-ascorbate metabolism protein UlaG (beta-lactamase superfamily)